jgi:hypothetical protein
MRSVIILMGLSLLCLGCAPTANSKKTAKDEADPPLMVIEEPKPEPAPPVIERVEAQVGVGKKGSSLKEHSGPVVTEVKAYFSAKEQIVFDIQVPSALALYSNMEAPPKSHEEFWEKVIVANQLESKMPELPKGHKYVFDPETQKLMVERPQQ